METLLLECKEEQPNPDDDSFQSFTSSSQPAKRRRTTKNRAIKQVSILKLCFQFFVPEISCERFTRKEQT